MPTLLYFNIRFFVCYPKLHSQFISGKHGSFSPKKGKELSDVSKDSKKNNSMYGFLCKRVFSLLFAEAGKSVKPSAWSHPGNQKKAWAKAFESGE